MTGLQSKINASFLQPAGLREMLPPGYDAIIFNGGGFNRLVWREIAPVDLTHWEG